ncbi:hypothetical protein ABZT04_09475 [Streptomyces sp. NPDC005492]|uniref:hypothetical protein n=1 Tax=Streptomyces sp. NPDC005492 TaxID=3156883 RepID=UPI0033B9A0E5
MPVYAEPGRGGGYVLDRRRTPLTVTPAEATAPAVGLHALAGTPFAADARSALHKVLAVMPERAAAAEMVALVPGGRGPARRGAAWLPAGPDPVRRGTRRTGSVATRRIAYALEAGAHS